MTPILFIDRDGTLIEEPADFQIDSFEKLRFVDGAIPALLRLRDAGYQFVMTTNQDGLGTPAFPRAAFDGPHQLMLQVLASAGISFRDQLIDTTLPADNAATRKPGIGLALPYLRDRGIDWKHSAVIGDRKTDVEFAENLGIRAYQLRTPQFGGDWDWSDIAHALADAPRTACVVRETRETHIRVSIDLDRSADPKIATRIGFFDHMLEQIGKHGGFSLELTCEGDTHIDEHHTVEDSALALGQALCEALGDKRGIARYGFTLPMDEALASAALDFSGRPLFVFDGGFTRERVGDLPTELVPHFFRSLCDAAGINLHLQVRGENDHHRIEACFKVVARALRQAIRREGTALPSTKGVL
ncbi:MAG: bifunctional histidinol-phosphatase/imidazoleglycerol-phosphate dehydratase HisB [Rudaea sp.]